METCIAQAETERRQIMILKGNEDLRIVKTIQGIKTAFEVLICEKDYEKITVKELCDMAQINKKTFYHYYETLDSLLAEMQAELSASYLEQIKNYALPEEFDKVNREFFVYSSNQGPAYEKITCSVAYHSIRDEMIAKVDNASWGKSKKYQKLSDFEKKLLLNFVHHTVLSAYRQWVEDGKNMPMEDVIDMTNCIVLGGVNKFMK